jgi:hypothetical protein
VDGVPSHEGIQNDIDAAPFRETDETLVETASYLVDLDKYARLLEDKSRTLFGQIKDVREDLCMLTASQNRLKDRFQSKDDLFIVRAHLLGCERIKVEKLEKNREENVANLVWLTCTSVYLRDKAERLRRTWEDADSLCVYELNGELPLESQREIHTETFELH